MHPVSYGAIAAAAVSTAALFIVPAPRETFGPPVASASAATPGPVLSPMPCPPRHLPEGAACVPLLDVDAPLEGDGDVQHERSGRGPTFALIPRRPDRPADPAGVRYPMNGPPQLLRGFDAGIAASRAASPASLELGAERGAPVLTLTLDRQEGKTRVVGMGRLFGSTVITAHTVREGERARVYLLVHGRLDGTGPDVKVGAELDPGAILGFVGDSGSPGLVSLYLEARQVREGVGIADLGLARLVDPSVSIATDARNVLPLK